MGITSADDTLTYVGSKDYIQNNIILNDNKIYKSTFLYNVTKQGRLYTPEDMYKHTPRNSVMHIQTTSKTCALFGTKKSHQFQKIQQTRRAQHDIQLEPYFMHKC